MFDPLPPAPDANALELEMLETWERERHVRAAPRAEPRRPALVVLRRAGDGEQVARASTPRGAGR